MIYRVLLLLGFIFCLCGCTVNYHHEQFRSVTKKSVINTADTKFFTRFIASERNKLNTKSYGPWTFSFKAWTKNLDYTNLVIESAVFTDSKGKRIVLVNNSNPQVRTFSTERQPVGTSEARYYSDDNAPLAFEFYEHQEVTLEIKFHIIDKFNKKSAFKRIIKYKANLKEGRDKVNIFTM
tara:strand:- start:117 stop:656 length:540 start_codon:yes stop_codon:yes gene_type:complete